MSLPSVAHFVSLIEKTRLLDAAGMDSLRAEVATHASDDVRQVAWAMVEKGFLTRWQANQILAGRLVFFLGKYKLIDLLGRGAIGNVFRAEHMALGRVVALKLLSKRMETRPEMIKAFYDEARIIATLNHRNIVHVFNVEHLEDRHFIVMEYVDGVDLRTVVVRRGALPLSEAADYVRQAAEGLAHAHAQGVVHRDVKPSNLMVARNGVLKILDLGTAKVDLFNNAMVGPSDMGTRSREELMQGTVDFMAPEQALDDPGLDHRADIYSLGCTLYFLVTGRPPFPQGTLAEKILKHQNETPPPLQSLVLDIPSELAGLCARMLSKSPEKRPASASEVARKLVEYVDPANSPR